MDNPQTPETIAAQHAAAREPSVLIELIQRMKVRDVMDKEPVTITRDRSLAQALDTMRKKKADGLPVVENGRLYGMVDQDDIIRALQGGYTASPCRDYMSTRLVVLEDDMPLSFAIRYLDRYEYIRFPVLNREREFVGVISQRDINKTLLKELADEFNRMELKAIAEICAGETVMLREFPVVKYDFENAGKAANTIKQLLQAKNYPPKLVRRIAVAAYELEINLCVHSDGGVLTWKVNQEGSEVIARDAGPGIEDVEWACKDGCSTANEWIRSLGFGAGMGLVNVKRVSDVFRIASSKGGGTTVRSVIHFPKDEAEKECRP